MNKLKGIDISYANKSIDFVKVKAAGICFVIIRTGYKQKTDDMFVSHIEKALKSGLEVGVYCYCLSKTKLQAIAEAEAVLKLIKPYTLSYPVCYDLEDEQLSVLSKTALTGIAAAFLDKIKAAGYKTALYANPSWLENRLELAKLKAHDIWLAHWTNNPEAPSKYDFGQTMWQWGIGEIAGITGKVDCDVSYKDYSQQTEKPKSDAACTVMKAADYLNIRSKPSLSGVRLGVVPPGASVTVTTADPVFSDGYYWAQISFGKINGFCAEKYLRK